MDHSKQWIVLINRAPRGPLTHEEILILLNERVIGTNDIASLVTADGASTDWKFLWQFPEFDRRLKEKPSQPPHPERRTVPISPKQISQRIQASVPEDLLNIDPTELSLKAKRPSSFESLESETLVPEEGSDSRPTRYTSLWVILLILFGIFLLVKLEPNTPLPAPTLQSERSVPLTRMPSAENFKSGPLQESARPVTKLRPPPAVTPPPPPPPPTAVERAQESKEEKDIANIEESDEQNREIASEEEDEEERPKKKRKQTKKKKVVEEEEDVSEGEETPADEEPVDD